jgi:hypothetical protein
LFEHRGRHWLAVQKALYIVHAEPLHEGFFCFRFDPFGDHLEIQLLSYRDHRAHQRLGLGVLVDRAHEAAIELDDIERNPSELRQRRIAGAEVIQVNLGAELAELRNQLDCGGFVFDQAAFGEFEVDEACLESRFLKRFGEMPDHRGRPARPPSA